MKLEELMEEKIERITRSMVKMFFKNIQDDDILSTMAPIIVAKYVLGASCSILSSIGVTFVANTLEKDIHDEAYKDFIQTVIEVISTKSFSDGTPTKEH